MQKHSYKNFFLFERRNKGRWDGQRLAISTALKDYMDNVEDDFVVKFEPHKSTTPKALRAYWRLVGIIADYINKDSDYQWSKEEISDNFKEQVGHTISVDLMPLWKLKYKNIKLSPQTSRYYATLDSLGYIVELGERMVKKPKSIARNSGCTYAEMNKLIEKLLQFGAEIPDCVLTPAEEAEFKKYYGIE